MYKILKIFLPIAVFAVLVTPSFASIEAPSYVGVCNPPSVTLSGNGVGEIKVDSSRVNDANGNWSLSLPLKPGSHNVSVGGESSDFLIPKCPEGGGVIQQGSCLGLFGNFANSCRSTNQGNFRFVPAGTANCPIWMTMGCNTTEPSTEEKEQKLVESLQKQITELIAQIARLLSARK